MAWNEPGNSGGKDPWGQRNKNQGPPDLDQVIKNIQDKLRGLFGGGAGGKRPSGGGNGNLGGYGVILVVVVALVLWLISGFYIVQQGERGVILQFGNYDETKMTQAGLHWRWPYPIETLHSVTTQHASALEIRYRSRGRSGVAHDRRVTASATSCRNPFCSSRSSIQSAVNAASSPW